MADPRDIDGINPTLMKAMNTDLENVQTLVQRHVVGFKDAFDRAGVDATPIKHLGEVAGWIGGQLPMLKRRQTMAEQMARENGTRPGSGMVGTEWEGNFASPEQARQRAREIADKYKDGKDLPPDAWAEILKNQRDPDFAEELCRRLGPDKLIKLADLYRSGGDEAVRQRFRALANAVATASQRGAFDQEAMRLLTERYHTMLALLKTSTVPWGADFLVTAWQRHKSNPALYPELNLRLVVEKNPQALQLLLADPTAHAMVRKAFTEDPELHKILIRKNLTPQQILEMFQVTPDARGMVWFPPHKPIPPDPKMSGDQWAKQVTVTESVMLTILYALGNEDEFQRIYAEAHRAPPFPAPHDDSHRDAFRHAYWNALLVRKFGYEWAARYTTEHERTPGSLPEREAMDLYNNAVGRQIAMANPHASEAELRKLIEDAVRGGRMQVIDKDGNLRFSNEVDPGKTGFANDRPHEPPQEPRKFPFQPDHRRR